MALNQPKNSLVIKIYLQELINKVLECHNNHAREYCWCILQSKWNYSVLKTIPLSCEGCLAPILWRDFDLAVPREPSSEGIWFLSTYVVQHFIREWSQERIMHRSII